MLAGLSPNQLSLVNTILASLVGGIVGILAAPLFQVDSTSLPFQIVPALGAALGLSLLLTTESLRQLSERFMPETEKELADRAALLSADDVPRAAVLIIGVACVAPLVEELFYRGALFGGLRRATSAASAALFSTLFFVIGHLNPKLWPQLLVVALVLGYLRAATGSLPTLRAKSKTSA